MSKENSISTNTPFSSLPLKEALLSNLTHIGFEAMTPIQAQTLPLIIAGKDVIGQGKSQEKPPHLVWVYCNASM